MALVDLSSKRQWREVKWDPPPEPMTKNIAFQKTAAQSSNYSEGGIPHCAAYAVDGNTDTDVSHRRCSYTNNAAASWQVLLDDHRMFNISRIRIYLRKDFWENNNGLQVLVNGDLCVPVSGTTPDWLHGPVTNPVDVTCTHVMKGNNVTITISGQFLTLCEVQVFVCSDGWFGSDCNKQCQCLDPSEVCDKETGYCRSGCAAGKHGPGCQQDCDHGHYGVSCSYTCGQCSGSSDCQKVNGTCTQGCQQGYSPPLCKVCNDRWFGTNCSKQCKCQNEIEVCDKTTGSCTSGCRAGKTGVGCQDDCVQGQYGINCSSTCGQCSRSSDCNKDDGHCTQGCQIGYLLPLCKDCVEGRYGVNCSQQCGSCKGDSPCNTTTGVCMLGCTDNFEEPYCKSCVQGKYSVNCSATCGHCKDGPGCDRSTGHCERGCLPGYAPPLCVKECGDYTYGLNCSGVCSCLNQCEVCDKVTGECGTGHQNTTTTTPTGTASPVKADDTGNATDVRFIVVCCLMVLLLAYSAVVTTLNVRLRRLQALSKAELEKQYMSLETPEESSAYDVISIQGVTNDV
ncbi:multiple epidermal growth factor-like domains protein 10 [Haliotis rubra]|uniref:multiple epidermal growth factor-like domains protein 10 n=1 Tax=Haliotis rubra TaxID=36100 RepID=UPI001EE4FD8F|nr:multiple epidermal growth factor-like domains protein 10 [Haliotis rubra]